jgi:hypothetical protein
MGVFSCTPDPEVDFDFDLVLDLGEGEEGILVDLIWSFDLVDLAITFELTFGLGLSFGLVSGLALVLESDLTVVVIVVLFDLVVWVFTGVRSSGSIFISESVGDRGNLIPIASTISITTTTRPSTMNK